jgi:hypothetical protein
LSESTIQKGKGITAIISKCNGRPGQLLEPSKPGVITGRVCLLEIGMRHRRPSVVSRLTTTRTRRARTADAAQMGSRFQASGDATVEVLEEPTKPFAAFDLFEWQRGDRRWRQIGERQAVLDSMRPLFIVMGDVLAD